MSAIQRPGSGFSIKVLIFKRLKLHIQTQLQHWRFNAQRLHRILSSRGSYELVASVIIATQNRASFLSYLLTCLEMQSIPKAFWELIVVDRGSRDDTADVMKRFIRRRRLQIRYREIDATSSIGAAKNEGVVLAKGKTVVFLADERIVERNFLLNHLTKQTRNDSIIIGVNTHALHTHLFCSRNRHMEGVQVQPMLSSTQIRDVSSLRRRLVQEATHPSSGHCDGDGMVMGHNQPWVFFNGANASVPAGLIKSNWFDECYVMAQAADMDFAFRAYSGGSAIRLASDIPAHRQLMPPSILPEEALEVDFSRLRRKMHPFEIKRDVYDELRAKAVGGW